MLLLVSLALVQILAINFEIHPDEIRSEEAFEIRWNTSDREAQQISSFALYRAVVQPNTQTDTHLLHENLGGDVRAYMWCVPGGQGDNSRDTFFILEARGADRRVIETVRSEVFKLPNARLSTSIEDYPYGYDKDATETIIEEEEEEETETQTESLGENSRQLSACLVLLLLGVLCSP
ncbi:MAG: uncharacterized protein A8A55_1516 [Amphiamblys sp. WSBS2006]|nr:MAG: uncharacterized protein A8A55_1516 [Amphiamblys sp. WSBS2006]